MSERRILIAAAILAGGARVDDLRKLALDILTECSHPNDKRALVPNNDADVAAGGMVACMLCKAILEKPSVNLWRIWQRTSPIPVVPKLLAGMTPEQASAFAERFNEVRTVPSCPRDHNDE